MAARGGGRHGAPGPDTGPQRKLHALRVEAAAAAAVVVVGRLPMRGAAARPYAD